MGGMEFNFLPNLPKSDLDDRKFEDLVEECLPRIPRYCPEWTNHNPSDPGITLVELFSWLTDQMLARFNQVPRRQYIAFLELLGIRLQPPPHGGHPPFPCPIGSAPQHQPESTLATTNGLTKPCYFFWSWLLPGRRGAGGDGYRQEAGDWYGRVPKSPRKVTHNPNINFSIMKSKCQVEGSILINKR
jgi:hypothetical protein